MKNCQHNWTGKEGGGGKSQEEIEAKSKEEEVLLEGEEPE